jgi:hypothetical protein
MSKKNQMKDKNNLKRVLKGGSRWRKPTKIKNMDNFGKRTRESIVLPFEMEKETRILYIGFPILSFYTFKLEKLNNTWYADGYYMKFAEKEYDCSGSEGRFLDYREEDKERFYTKVSELSKDLDEIILDTAPFHISREAISQIVSQIDRLSLTNVPLLIGMEEDMFNVLQDFHVLSPNLKRVKTGDQFAGYVFRNYFSKMLFKSKVNGKYYPFDVYAFHNSCCREVFYDRKEFEYLFKLNRRRSVYP